MKKTSCDVAIIGAGPAGAAAAALLHREGFAVQIFEKQTFPRFVIGESLLPHSMDLLEQAGLLTEVDRQGFMRKCGAVFLQADQSCNFDFADQFTDGWEYTYQVPRADFDKTLADTVAARGVPIHYRHEVTGVQTSEAGAQITVRDAEGKDAQVDARFVLDCSGYGRVLPRLLDLEMPSSFPPREALFAHVRGDRRPTGREEGKIWACLHPGGAWIWIIPFSNGRTSVGVVAEPGFFQRYPGDAQAQFRAIIASEPNAAARLESMELAFVPQRISGYACAVKRLCGPGFALVGNATEFLDPIFSSGVTLALESASCAARTLSAQLRGQPVDWQTAYADYLMRGINTFRTYVAAWYDRTLPRIFFAPQRNPVIMKQICSVLAGYVWDTSNPYVVQPERALPLLARIVQSQSGARGN